MLDRSGGSGGVRQSAQYSRKRRVSDSRYARSNGVAAGVRLGFGVRCSPLGADRAGSRPSFLVWRGMPVPSRAAALAALGKLQQEYDFERTLSRARIESSDTVVAGSLRFPCGFGNPVVYGFGAHSQQDRAIEKATRECVQRLGFLWGETLPQSEPQFMANAEYHQEFYLQPRMQLRLRAWLSGEHMTMRCRIRIAAQGCLGRWYVDLTPVGLKQQHFRGKSASYHRARTHRSVTVIPTLSRRFQSSYGFIR